MGKQFNTVNIKKAFTAVGDLKVSGLDDIMHCQNLLILVDTDTTADRDHVTITTSTAKGLANVTTLFTKTSTYNGSTGYAYSLTNQCFSDIIVMVNEAPTSTGSIYITVLASNS